MCFFKHIGLFAPKKEEKMDDLTFMNMAAQVASLADKALTFENPRVGAVVVKHGKILSIGYHKKFGESHAEINAYNQLSDKSQIKGATMYVTLEPCAVRGKVNSCAETMQDWGLRRVVIGSIDPNPRTRGQGVAILKNANVLVSILNTQHSRELNPEFHQYFENRLPYIQLKVATSLNGFVSTSNQQRVKLTDDRADSDVHHERATRSAIMIGSQTFLTDLPNLTVRHSVIDHKQPARIVVDRRGRLKTLPYSYIKDWVVYTENEEFASFYENIILMHDGLIGILNDLFDKKVQSVMVEGGPTFISSFLTENLWQEMIVYKTNKILNKNSLAAVSPTMKPVRQTKVGNAIKSVYINQNWRF